MASLIRNCGFSWFYTSWEPRLWILYEVTEIILTSNNGLLRTEDIKIFQDHITEMLHNGVEVTLHRHGYRCSDDRDWEYLVSWMGLLVLLWRLRIDIMQVRRLMDNLTWQDSAEEYVIRGLDLRLKKYDGSLVVAGESHFFHPFPR